jgi:uncharacterized repeat protein (TIGR03803 family)
VADWHEHSSAIYFFGPEAIRLLLAERIGNGVIYRFDQDWRQYPVLHTFSAMDANGDNEDGASPGNGLTAGPNGAFYGMAIFGGPNGAGTIFKITTSGQFTVVHAFSAVDANGNNEGGANPLRNIVVGNDGNLYGTTRIHRHSSRPITDVVLVNASAAEG